MSAALESRVDEMEQITSQMVVRMDRMERTLGVHVSLLAFLVLFNFASMIFLGVIMLRVSGVG